MNDGTTDQVCLLRNNCIRYTDLQRAKLEQQVASWSGAAVCVPGYACRIEVAGQYQGLEEAQMSLGKVLTDVGGSSSRCAEVAAAENMTSSAAAFDLSSVVAFDSGGKIDLCWLYDQGAVAIGSLRLAANGTASNSTG